jgi:hypothetical protein
LREGLGAGFAGFLEAGFLAGAFFLVGFLAMSLGEGVSVVEREFSSFGRG